MTNPKPFWADTPAQTTRRGHFWISGERVTQEGLTYQLGTMFAEWFGRDVGAT